MGALAAVGAAAHGFMAEPRARNVVHNSNYCPHCLSSGGPGVTYAGGRVWPNSLHGVCGDPHTGPLDHEGGGKFATNVVTGRYAPGATITIKMKITAPHGGRFSFGICPVPDGVTGAAERAVVTQKCFDSNRLKNVADGTDYWWFGKKPSGDYTMQFKLPPGVTCKRCVLQWHYESGNSCAIPGTPPEHSVSANLVPCPQTGVMEEFWNCADVSVGAGGKDDAGAPLPVTQSPPVAAAAAAPAKTKKPKKPKKKKKKRENFEDAAPAPQPAGGVVTPTGVAALGAVVMAVAVLPVPLAVGLGVAAAVYVAALGAPEAEGGPHDAFVHLALGGLVNSGSGAHTRAHGQ